jgi:hypothetical protein
MTKTIVAIFDDIAVARQVVEDLVNADFARNSISLITNDAHNQYSHYLDKDYAPKDDAVTAAQGAGFGAVVGVLTGVLVGLAALMIPGIGLAIVAGPIVAGLTGAVAGTLTGGIVGALVKTGVPEDEAPYYAEGIRRGGTLISIQTSDVLRAEDIMNRHGAINIHERINVWRQAGWKGFDDSTELVKNEDTVQSPPAILTAAPLDTASTEGAPVIRDISPITVVPVVPVIEEIPPIDDEDTTESHPVLVAVPATDTAVTVIPTPNEVTAEPVLPVVEGNSHVE